MNRLQAVTRRAAWTAFLPFAAVLLLVAPAEASVPRSAGVDQVDAVALASLERPALGLASPTLEPSGFSLGEDLSVFDTTKAQGSLGLCGLETRRCALTYARNNPLKYVDPDGRAAALAEAVAGGIEAAGAFVSRGGAAVNNGTLVGIALDATLGTAGDLVGGMGDMFRVGDSIGGAMGSGASGGEFAEAVRQDFVRGASLFVAVAVPANAGLKALTTTEVVHFTSNAGGAAIQEAGSLRAGTYVTKPGEVRGMTAPQVETALEIGPGKGTNSFTFRTSNRNLVVPENGATTSGGAYQRQLVQPCGISGVPCVRTTP